MSELPKWIVANKYQVGWEDDIQRALSIAWEALWRAEEGLDNHVSEEQTLAQVYRDELRKAMRRIEEIGK